MVKDYWPAYQECPDCGKRQKNNQAYFWCKDKDCSYKEPEFKGKIEREKKIKGKIKEIMEYLLTNDPDFNEPLPLLKFPKSADITHDHFLGVDNHIDCVNDAGWYDPPPLHQVSIPQKALYLPNKEIVEVASHETAHVPTWKNSHGEKFHHKYMDYRRKAFSEFTSFANEPYEAKYTINFNKEFYKKTIGFNLEDLKYDPYEDD